MFFCGGNLFKEKFSPAPLSKTFIRIKKLGAEQLQSGFFDLFLRLKVFGGAGGAFPQKAPLAKEKLGAEQLQSSVCFIYSPD